MDSGFYAAANAARRSSLRLEVLSNNLANVNTNGFKGENVRFESYMTGPGIEQFPLPTDNFLSPRAPGQVPFPFMNPASNAYPMTYPAAIDTSADLSQGAMKETGNAMDVALDGPGLFVVQSPDGRRLTRDGAFSINIQGQIVTKDGYPVLGEGGAPITVGGGYVGISPDGIVNTEEGPVGRMARVMVSRDDLKKVGGNLYTADRQAETQWTPQDPGGFKQGFIETSNVNPVVEMTRMIESHRSYNAYLEMIKALDALDGHAVDAIGTIRE